MKISKKLIATVAMAAVCCTLHMPTVAGAGTYTAPGEGSTCPPHHLVRTNVETKPTTTDQHKYIFAYIYDENGKLIEIDYGNCITTTTYLQYDLSCQNCILLLYKMGPGKVTKHSSCGAADEVSPYSVENTQTE